MSLSFHDQLHRCSLLTRLENSTLERRRLPKSDANFCNCSLSRANTIKKPSKKLQRRFAQRILAATALAIPLRVNTHIRRAQTLSKVRNSSKRMQGLLRRPLISGSVLTMGNASVTSICGDGAQRTRKSADSRIRRGKHTD